MGREKTRATMRGARGRHTMETRSDATTQKQNNQRNRGRGCGGRRPEEKGATQRRTARANAAARHTNADGK
eukprot:11168803-Lingulodinium_polyedra.AAC.1